MQLGNKINQLGNNKKNQKIMHIAMQGLPHSLHFFLLCTMYRRDRNLDDNGEVIRGGGVLMYITNNLKHYEIDHDVNNTESLWCTIQTAHGNSVKLGVCYDSTSNTKEDSDRLYNIMRTECQLNTIVCGDFNRPGINWDDMTSDKHGERLLE